MTNCSCIIEKSLFDTMKLFNAWRNIVYLTKAAKHYGIAKLLMEKRNGMFKLLMQHMMIHYTLCNSDDTLYFMYDQRLTKFVKS